MLKWLVSEESNIFCFSCPVYIENMESACGLFFYPSFATDLDVDVPLPLPLLLPLSLGSPPPTVDDVLRDMAIDRYMV
jgi:hypothetical protein